jgi:hypothetical protein
MPKLSIRDIELANKRLFIRVDFNVPLTEDGATITDDTRIVGHAAHHRLRPQAQGQGDSGLASGPSQGQAESQVFAAPGG